MYLVFLMFVKFLFFWFMIVMVKFFLDFFFFNSSSFVGFENVGNEDGGFFLISIDIGIFCR